MFWENFSRILFVVKCIASSVQQNLGFAFQEKFIKLLKEVEKVWNKINKKSGEEGENTFIY